MARFLGGMRALPPTAILVALLLAPACGGGGGGGDAKPAGAKVLQVGSDIEYAPIEFYKENTQEPQGLDVDLARALGDKLGMTVTFVNDTDFAGIIGALRTGRFDIVMSAMNDTAERRGKGVDFIDYFRAGSAILVQKGNPRQVKGLDDLCGTTVAVQKGTTQDTDILTAQEAKCRTAGRPSPCPRGSTWTARCSRGRHRTGCGSGRPMTISR